MGGRWSGRRRLLTAVVATATVAATIAAYLALTAGPATAKQFATLTVLEGTVEVKETGTSSFQPGTTGDTLRQGDAVRTGDDGRAEIEYFDGSVTRLDAGTELVLKELASVPDVPDSKTIVADQTSGKTLNRVVELTDSESRFETETPSAVASVRGTIYVVFVHPNGSSEYWVFDGTLLIELPDGTIVELNAGEGVFVSSDGEAGEVFEVTDQDLEELCDLDPEFCPDEVQGTEIEEEQDETEEGDEVQGTTVTREETDDDVTLIPPVVIIRPDPSEDNDPPNTSIEDGPSGESEERHATFVVTADEPNATFECSLQHGEQEEEFGACPTPVEDASRSIQAHTTTSLTVFYTDLIDGLYEFQVRATDAAGNTENTPASRTWTVSAPPDTTIVSAPPQSSDQPTAIFILEADEDGVTFECSRDGQAFQACPPSPVPIEEVETQSLEPGQIEVFYDGLFDGPHTFQARATDPLGKVEPEPAQHSWTVDTGEVPTPQLSMTLTWPGPQPQDLDLHLLTPTGTRVWYSDRFLPSSDDWWARLNQDDRSAPGSETITILLDDARTQNGLYEIRIHNYSCEESLSVSSADVSLFGPGISRFQSVPTSPSENHWDLWTVARFRIDDAGISFDPIGTLTDGAEFGNCPGAPVEATDRTASSLVVRSEEQLIAPVLAVTERLAIHSIDPLEVNWAPAELEGEVRVSSEEFPDEITDGELGCRGVGHCVIEGLEPGTTLYLTVFPAGVTALEPVEDVTSLRIEVPPLPEPSPEPTPEPSPEQDPAVENDPPPEPEPSPSPSPPPPSE